jgi:hypothetical protein
MLSNTTRSRVCCVAQRQWGDPPIAPAMDYNKRVIYGILSLENTVHDAFFTPLACPYVSAASMGVFASLQPFHFGVKHALLARKRVQNTQT